MRAGTPEGRSGAMAAAIACEVQPCRFLADAANGPVEEKPEISTAPARDSAARLETDRFFVEPTNAREEALAMAAEVIGRLLVWMADGRSLEARGLRACVALYCIRPDLVEGMTLEQLGELAGCSRQAVHKLATGFRATTGLPP